MTLNDMSLTQGVKGAVQMVVPSPDSHFRLKECLCGNDQPAYFRRGDGKWQVQCMNCGRMTDRGEQTRHGAQLRWNGRK